MIVRRLAFASLFFSPLAWGIETAPPAGKVIVLAGADVHPIKVSDASKRSGDSLKPAAGTKTPVDITAVLRRTFDENGLPHYQCDADHSSADAGAANDRLARRESP